jgi:hypothetical protein
MTGRWPANGGSRSPELAVRSSELITKLANLTVAFPDSLVCDFETALPRVVGRGRMGLCRRQPNRPSGVDFGEGCFNRREYVTAETPYEIVTRGWLDVRNRISPARTTPTVPGRPYTFRWNLQPNDHVFAAGHRIGLVIISTERDHTLRYPAGTVVGVSEVRLA